MLLEGTQATYLSLFHGTYPFVTTKDVTASAICSDVGIGPTVVTDVIIVFKAYVTRVGKGFLPDELSEEETINRGWSEYGTVTKRLRRAAPFNVELAKRSIQLNSATRVAITKLDVLFPLDRGKTNFDELTEEAKNWVYKTEKDLGTETVNGFKCRKKSVEMVVEVMGFKTKSRSVVWISKKLDMPVRTRTEDGYVTELRNIKKGRQSKKLFEIPSGYKKVGNMMETFAGSDEGSGGGVSLPKGLGDKLKGFKLPFGD